MTNRSVDLKDEVIALFWEERKSRCRSGNTGSNSDSESISSSGSDCSEENSRRRQENRKEIIDGNNMMKYYHKMTSREGIKVSYKMIG